ncbi:tetratricopeptide repeat protein [Pedobacter sp. KLB.chiD]|uniref:tetratricopeptide repeat protein n=1 Tax=Pedobacter sp. KLB.chiD TaxID=3387402 RepID=UPI00399BABF2
MKSKILIFLSILNVLTACAQDKMEQKYFTWQMFSDGFGKEMVAADDVFNKMLKSGLRDNCLTRMDFTFISDKKENLQKLGEFIRAHYPYDIKEIERSEGLWEINGETNEIPITRENLLYWCLDMYKRGYEFDSKLDAYGGPFDPKDQQFPELNISKANVYFDKGLECYNNEDLSGALINWTLSIQIDPANPDAYYSRAIVKNELYTWKSALRDYDKAIEIAPDFSSALLNRGSVKDENGDYAGAVEDYKKVLTLKNVDLEDEQKAYYNLGNTKYNLGDKDDACRSWKKSFDLGADYAYERIQNHCENYR